MAENQVLLRKTNLKHLAEVAQQAREKAAKIEAQKKSRLEQLVKRLNDRGWGDAAWMHGGTLLNQFEGRRYPEVEMVKNTTARLANQLDDALIARLTTDKRSAILRERLRTFRDRPSHIVEPPASFQLAIVPRRIDIALIPQIRALVDPSGDLDASPTAEQLTAALEPIYLPLLQNWATEALNEVSNHAIECLELPPSTPNVLDLAIAVVPCPGKCTHTAQHFRAWRPHPGQSCRAGNRWSNPSPEHFSGWGLSIFRADRRVPEHSDPSDEYCTEAEDILWDRPFDPTVYKFATGNVAESLKNIWKRVKCVVCEKKETTRTQTSRKSDSLSKWFVGPHSWQKAIYHCLTAHATDRQPTTWVLCS
uniref:Uncharacterized protein n=1 Tax=Mycena chlorophos TaxID=658473 RepID=A0ABQ0LWR3_MYCCL|nr:predicted protein [Mycena chlorophos]